MICESFKMCLDILFFSHIPTFRFNSVFGDTFLDTSQF